MRGACVSVCYRKTHRCLSTSHRWGCADPKGTPGLRWSGWASWGREKKWWLNATTFHPLLAFQLTLFYLLTSTWWPKWTLMDPPESSMLSPSEVLTISVGFLIRNGCLNHPKSEYNVKEKTYSPSNWNGIQWRTWSLIWSAEWPCNSWSESLLQVHCSGLRGDEKRRYSRLHRSSRIVRSVIIPCLETNCEATPTSKDAKTGEWSLVMMSVVHPVNLKIQFKYLCHKKQNTYTESVWNSHFTLP